MNILELNFERAWRGGERQTIYNIQGLVAAGISTHLLCRKDSALHEQACKLGLIVHAFQSKWGVLRFLLTKGRQYQVMHAQTSQILTYCVFTKKIHGAKVVFTRRVNYKQKGFLTRLKYRRTSKLVAISEAIKHTLAIFSERKDIEVISDIVVPSATDQARIDALRHQVNSGNKHIIGTTAALTYEKDPFTMLSAVKTLAARSKDFVFLHFGTGKLEGELRQKIVEEGLQEHYLLMGFVANVEAILPLLEIFAISSSEEGLGSSVLDAFIKKIPVVSTNAGGLANLLSNDRGIVCDVGNAAAIAAGVEALLTNMRLAAAYTDKAFAYVHEYHSMNFITRKYITLFENIAATAK